MEKAIWILTVVCFVAMLASFPFSKVARPLAAGSFLEFYQDALRSRFVLFALPIASVLPAGGAYVREALGGFLRLYCVRVSRMEYIRRKTVQLYVSGVAPFLLSGLAFLFCNFLCIYPIEVKGNMNLEVFAQSILLLLRICLTGGLLALFSGIFAALFQNFYMAYGLPFVCFYLFMIIRERYLPGLYALCPEEWIACECYWGEDGSGIYLFFIAFTAAAAQLHGLMLCRRLKEVA